MAREGTIQIGLAGEPAVLDPRRALMLTARQTLVIADPHIGKDSTFRRAGIPVPAGVAAADFARLTDLLNDYAPARLVILGDFLHARPGDKDTTIDLLAEWRDRHRDIQVLIVRGNHDWHAGPPPQALNLTSVDEPHRDGPFAYRHFPIDAEQSSADGYVLAGHLHPGVTVELGCQSARRVPCFHITDSQAILPAFGAFTGTARITQSAGGSVYAVGRDRVIALPRPAMI